MVASPVRFNERMRGCVKQTGDGASITEPRVKFRKGWLTGGTDPADGSVECGDGTLYPMQATLEQVYEIFYRARDGWMTAGTFDMSTIGAAFDPPEDPPLGTFGITGTPDPTQLLTYEEGWDVVTSEFFDPDYYGLAYSRRGLVAFETDPPFYWVDFIQSQLPAGTQAAPYFDANYAQAGNWIPRGEAATITASDANSELAIWTIPDSHFISPMSFRVATMPDTSGATRGLYKMTSDSELPLSQVTGTDLHIEPTVAYVGADHPFDPAATLYVKLHFSMTLDVFGWTTFNGVTSFIDPRSLTIILATGAPITVQLYSAEFPEGSGPASVSPVYEVKKWWPYANPDGTPVWDEATGAKL